MVGVPTSKFCCRPSLSVILVYVPGKHVSSYAGCRICVIFFARVVVSERLRRARGGVRGGAARPPLGGCRGARGGSGAAPPKKKKKFWADIFSPVSSRHIIAGPTYFRDDIFPGPHDIRWFSAHGFCRWFSISG
jgi:hypothetical protein